MFWRPQLLVQLVPSPMQALEKAFAPFDSPDYIFEIKVDGYRGMARIEDGKARLFTKSRAECTTWFPEIVTALA